MSLNYRQICHKVVIFPKVASILGPVLFLVFTNDNDLSQHVLHGKLIMYADDTQFIDTDSPENLPQLKRRVEENILSLSFG